MDLFTPAQRSEISSVMRDLFDTFARSFRIRFFKEVAQVFVADPNYNSDFQSKIHNKNIKTAVSEEFQARIWYLDRQEVERFLQGDDTHIRMDNDVNRIRIQIPIEGLSYLESAVRFEFNGMKWQKESSVSQIGHNSELQFCECYLFRVN